MISLALTGAESAFFTILWKNSISTILTILALIAKRDVFSVFFAPFPKVETLFPSKMMIPTGFNIDECECGNLFSVKKHESSHPLIHHGKPTKDSRNSLLSIYFLETTQCACKRFYHGEEDRLVRVSSAPAQPQSNVHFVSVDLLNEYLSSLFGTSQQGKSIDAFISNKNDLNREQRGENIEITRSVFFKAFEIYIHAIKYDAEEAFGCPQCPGELLRGEKEEDFPNAREVHITDGIDMGCMQNEKKGIVSKEMFEIPTVDSGAVNFFVLVLKQNQHFLRFYEKSPHQHFLRFWLSNPRWIQNQHFIWIYILQFSSHPIYPIPSIHLRHIFFCQNYWTHWYFKLGQDLSCWSRINIFYDSIKI